MPRVAEGCLEVCVERIRTVIKATGFEELWRDWQLIEFELELREKRLQRALKRIDEISESYGINPDADNVR